MEIVDRKAHSQKELSNCTFVKTVLMLLVVFYHSILFWGGNWFSIEPAQTSAVLGMAAKWLKSFHIYGFALVSGYIFYHLKCEQGKYNKFGVFLKNKAKRLLLPYVFVAVFWVIPISAIFFETDIVSVFRNYVLAEAPSQLWFLVMLFDVFAIFWPLSGFFQKHNYLGALVALGMYGCGLVGSLILPNIFNVWTALQYIPLFWIGFKLRQYGAAVIRRIPAFLWLVADIVLFGFMQFLGGFESVAVKLLLIGLDFVLKVVGACMSFVVLQKIADAVNWNGRVFAFVSKSSMAVYLFHQQIIYFFLYWLNGYLYPGVHVIINFIGAMAISLLLASVLLKFKATRVLIGEK